MVRRRLRSTGRHLRYAWRAGRLRKRITRGRCGGPSALMALALGEEHQKSGLKFTGFSEEHKPSAEKRVQVAIAAIRLKRAGRLLGLVVILLVNCVAAVPQADRIVVLKGERKLILYRNGTILKSYKIALGPNSVGPKQKQGDHRTPEGLYQIDSKNAHSRFHLALHVSYPDQQDRERARKMGVKAGGDIMIHGLPDRYAFMGTLHTKYDWTDGCIAVSNSEIEEIWKLVPVGTPVEIKP